MGILNILIIKPLKIRSAKKYFLHRFGPAFFLRPAYCADCEKKPIQHKVTAEEAEQSVNRSMAMGMPAARVEIDSLISVCPECYNWMNVSSWDRFRAGFLDGTFTVEEFENMEGKTYSNVNFVSETLNQNS
jgi:hypothetical protein